MAIEQHVLVAVAISDSKEFRLANVEDELYPEFVYDDFAELGYELVDPFFSIFFNDSLKIQFL